MKERIYPDNMYIYNLRELENMMKFTCVLGDIHVRIESTEEVKKIYLPLECYDVYMDDFKYIEEVAFPQICGDVHARKLAQNVGGVNILRLPMRAKNIYLDWVVAERVIFPEGSQVSNIYLGRCKIKTLKLPSKASFVTISSSEIEEIELPDICLDIVAYEVPRVTEEAIAKAKLPRLFRYTHLTDRKIPGQLDWIPY